MKKNLLFLLLLSVMGAQHSICGKDSQQKPSASAQINKTKKQKNIEAIIDLTFNKDITLRSMKANFQQVTNSFEGQIPQEFLPEIKNVTNNFFEKISQELLSDEVIKQMGSLYDEIYTEKEVEELLKFYESEVGRKNIQKLPEITSKITSISKTVLEKHMTRYIAEMTAIQAKVSAASKK
jgi:uncharacterized protein